MAELDARIPCTDETRTEIRSLCDGSERYEDLLRRMLEVYKEHEEDA